MGTLAISGSIVGAGGAISSWYTGDEIFAMELVADLSHEITQGGAATFTRAAGTSTITEDDKNIVATITNEARFKGSVRNGANDYTATSASDGLLIEEVRTNVCTDSADLSVAAKWKISDSTVTTNQTTAPDGTSEADQLNEFASANLPHYIYWAPSGAAVPSGKRCLSIYAKQNHADLPRLILDIYDSAYKVSGTFDLSTGAVVNISGTAADKDYGIEDAGNGWYRCWVVATTTGLSFHSIYMGTSSNDSSSPGSSESHVGVNGRTMYLWGADFEDGIFPTSYKPTTGSSVTRPNDVLSDDSDNYPGVVGTYYCEFEKIDGGVSGLANLMLGFMNAATTQYNEIFINSLDKISIEVDDTSGAEDVTSATTVGTGKHKVAYSYESGAQSVYLDGTKVITGAMSNIPVSASIDTFRIGHGGLADTQLNGTVKHIRLWGTKLSDERLQALTT